jgi:hypothetical protein
VGEVETIVAMTRIPVDLDTGPCQVAAGVVAFADVLLGERVEAVLDALVAAGEQRLRGIRYRTAVTGGPVGRTIVSPPRPHLLLDPRFQQGIAKLERYGLAFDVWAYDEQLGEVAALADACPGVCFVVDHLGGPVGVLEHDAERAERRRLWLDDLKRLAQRPNVKMKVGGMGMTMFGFGFEHRECPRGPPNSPWPGGRILRFASMLSVPSAACSRAIFLSMGRLPVTLRSGMRSSCWLAGFPHPSDVLCSMARPLRPIIYPTSPCAAIRPWRHHRCQPLHKDF